MEEYLKNLGITGNLHKSTDGSLIMDIEDSKQCGKIYSKLDNAPDLDEVPSSSQVTYESSSIQYTNNEYTITLLADLEGDNYRLTIREN